MSEVLHANIFFFIASFGVIVFTLMGCIVLYHIIKIMVAIRRLVERVEAGSEAIASDMVAVREYISAKGTFFSQLISFFAGSASPRRSARRKKAARDIVITEE